MNKNEIKKDVIAEKIVQFVAYLKNNLKLVLVILAILVAVVVILSRNASINENKKNNALKETDKIMIDLISSVVTNNSLFETI